MAKDKDGRNKRIGWVMTDYGPDYTGQKDEHLDDGPDYPDGYDSEGFIGGTRRMEVQPMSNETMRAEEYWREFCDLPKFMFLKGEDCVLKVRDDAMGMHIEHGAASELFDAIVSELRVCQQAARAQSAEPVAWMDGDYVTKGPVSNCSSWVPLYTAQPPAREQVPSGWQLVPVEPTGEMLRRGTWSGNGDVGVDEEWARKVVYQRMLAASPEPPEE